MGIIDQERLRVQAEGVRQGLGQARNPEEAMALVGGFLDVAAGLGLNPLDRRAALPLLEALRDPRLQGVLRDGTSRAYRGLCGRLSRLAEATPVAGLEDVRAGLETWLALSRRVESGYYRSRPESFLADYAALRGRLDSLSRYISPGADPSSGTQVSPCRA